MIKKLYFLIYICLFVKTILHAQHPVFTQLTEKDGLPDIEFYDLIEDKDGFIWMAADKGLFRYDGKKFKNYSHPDKRGLSVFGLKFDNQGRLWCNNISGQFFYVENDELHLFEVEVDARGILTNFLFYKDCLWVSSYKYGSKIELKTKRETVFKNTDYETVFFKKDTLFFCDYKKIEFTVNNVHKSKKTLFNDVKEDLKWGMNNSFLFDNKVIFYGYDLRKKENKTSLLTEENNKLLKLNIPIDLKENFIINVFIEDNLIWFCTKNGVYVYTYEKNKFILKKTYFKGNQITKIIKDRNNNYWFSSLRNGIYIVSNIYLEKYNLTEKATNISVMKSISNTNILIGSTKGSMVEVNKDTKEITYINSKENDKVFSMCNLEKKVFISLENSFAIFNKETKKIEKSPFSLLGNVKDFATINDTEIVFALYNNAQVLNLKNNTVQNLGDKRSYSVHYSHKSKNIYVGYVDGLKRYNEQLESTPILFDSKPIFAINIEETDSGIIWVSTFKDGLIGVKKGKVVERYTTKNGLLSNETSTIKADGNLLWVVTNKGIQVLNTITKKLKNLTPKDGITTFNITDIVPTKNTIFFSSNKGLFEFDREKVFQKRVLSNFYIKNIFIDDEEVLEKDLYNLKHTTKKIQFNFHTNGFLAEDNITYKYRLLGASKIWEKVPEKVGLVRFNSLASGKYIFQLKAVENNGIQETVIKTIDFTVRLPFYKEWYFILLCILSIFSLIGYLFLLREKKIRSEQKEVLEKEKIQRQLVASKLESLQAQMNPHFTFNALNSIQNLVLKGNKYEAYDYLNKFSLLIRENLNMSKKSYVSFEEELQMLTKYLELEQLRFRTNFEYTIEGDLEIGDIKIPTMIIQPYIENAIKHGLLHKKEGEKKLTIKFLQKEVLICEIIDNGVGIEASKKINKANTIKKESFSTAAIKDKMRFLKDYYKTDIGVFYEDISVGTKVVIKIPFTVL